MDSTEIFIKISTSLLTPTAAIGIAYYFNKTVLPRIQSQNQLKKDFQSFHEKYLKISDKISSSKLHFTTAYEMTKKYYDFMMLAKNQNVETLNKDGFKKENLNDFLDLRKDYYRSRIEYITNIVSLINLYYDELNYLKNGYPDHLQIADIQSVYITFNKWITSSIEELEYHFKTLDKYSKVSEQKNFYTHKFQALKLETPMNKIASLAGDNVLSFEQKKFENKLDFEIPNYQHTLKIFDDYSVNESVEYPGLHPFWISENDFLKISRIAA